MTEVRITTPPGMFGASASDGTIDTAMRIIGVGFGSPDEWASKYGTDYENEIFLMKRFCWCEREGECPWCTGCGIYQDRGECRVCANESLTVEQRRAAPADQRCDYSAGRGIFARFAPWTLDRARHYYDPPNFWFKPTDFRLKWYKYIGRDTASNKGELPSDLLQQIFRTHPRGMTVDDAIAETSRREENSAKAFQAMFGRLESDFRNCT